MNNRGKKLTNLELLKNRLIYLTTLFDEQQLDTTDQARLRRDINNTWKEVYYQLGRDQKAPLSDDEFLRGHWITYFQYTRKRGDDYIRFLLNKFSAKNVFEKITVSPSTNGDYLFDEFGEIVEDDFSDDLQEPENISLSKLSPKEISDYVNSLKETAEPWYYSFFPDQSPTLTEAEKVWIDRLNRIGIGYFRPVVVSMFLIAGQTTVKERVDFLSAVERFIFLAFRVGRFNASYKSSDYYRKSRDLLLDEISLNKITADLNSTIESDMENLVANFITHTDRRFDKGDGFYSWRDLKYFLYEYEYQLSVKKNITKIGDWSLFSRVERDKVTIEHILPQTPTNWYWRNQFRQFDEEEIKLLTGSLGNLLPLAQSINSSLQNDSFHDKKNPTARRRRGYTDGSHSEIEVSAYEDWDAIKILARGNRLLEFMSGRWGIPFTDEQKKELLHIDFVNDGRDIREELQKDPHKSVPTPGTSRVDTNGWTQRQHQKYNFWKSFVDYCETQGRSGDIAIRKPTEHSYYDVPIGSKDYHALFQILSNDQLVSGLYVNEPDAYERLEASKREIESVYGSELEWYRSPKDAHSKRIVHSIQTDIYNPNLYIQHFDWLIARFDDLIRTLKVCDGYVIYVDNENILSNKMTAVAHNAAKKVYEGTFSRSEGVREIVKLSGMNEGSAGDCIQGFLAMMNGERYTRTLNGNLTRYFLDHILADYGGEALVNAVKACQLHAEYYAKLGYGKLRYIERIVEEYSRHG
jgi:hypothetical protein